MVAARVMCEIPAIPDNHIDQERQKRIGKEKNVGEQKIKMKCHLIEKSHKFNPLNTFSPMPNLYLNANSKFNMFKCSDQKAKRLMSNPIFPHRPINPVLSQPQCRILWFFSSFLVGIGRNVIKHMR